MQKSRGGMGSHKHAVSGTAGPNRRELQARARFVNKLNEKPKKAKTPMFDTVGELMASKKKEK